MTSELSGALHYASAGLPVKRTTTYLCKLGSGSEGGAFRIGCGVVLVQREVQLGVVVV